MRRRSWQGKDKEHERSLNPSLHSEGSYPIKLVENEGSTCDPTVWVSPKIQKVQVRIFNVMEDLHRGNSRIIHFNSPTSRKIVVGW